MGQSRKFDYIYKQHDAKYTTKVANSTVPLIWSHFVFIYFFYE